MRMSPILSMNPEEDRRQRYLHSTLSESSDVEFWMSLHHHSDSSSSEESEQIPTDEVSERVLSALDQRAETLRNTAIAAWLLARVNRRLTQTTDVSTTMVSSDRSSSLGVALRNMTRGQVSADPNTMRRILREFSKLSPRADSPTNHESGQEIQRNYFNDEVNATTPLLGRNEGFMIWMQLAPHEMMELQQLAQVNMCDSQ